MRRANYWPQSVYLRDVPIGYIGRFEDYEYHLEEIAAVIDKPLPVIEVVNATKHKPYQKYYCSKSKFFVDKYCKEDFWRFGYEPEIK